MIAGLASWWLRLRGWQVEGEPPTRSCVYLAYPHSSNWDGWMLLLHAWALSLDLRWMIKEQWLKGPMGLLLRRLGAVGVDRSASTGMVGQMVAEFEARDFFMLCVPPEGTRSRRDYWKSGFYHIAREAKVPLCLGVLDYGAKRAGFGPMLELTGDMHTDMERVRAHYAERGPKARFPSNTGPIRLRAEDEESA